MTFAVADRIFETSVTTGTGTYTLAGAQTGYQAFSTLGANNDTTYFATDGTNWEVGIGTVLTGPARLQRTTILASSNGGAAVNWGGSTINIRCGVPAAGITAPRRLSKSVAGNTDVTLTTDEQRRNILEFTGALTGSINVIVDATPWVWTVKNKTSGAFTLTLKVSGQTGIVVPQGGALSAYCDGTDVIDDDSAHINPSNLTQALTDAAPTTWDVSKGAIATWTMGASRTLSAPTNLKTGARYVLIITQDATGGRQVTWNAVFKNAAGSMPQPNLQASAVTAFTFTSPDGTNLRLESNEAMVLLASASASGSSSLDFTNLAGFAAYLFTFDNIYPASSGDVFGMRTSTDNGATYATSGYIYNAINFLGGGSPAILYSNAGASIQLHNSMSSAGIANGNSGTAIVYPGADHLSMNYDFCGFQTSPTAYGLKGWGYKGSANVNAVRWLCGTGNITGGTIKCYGLRG